MSTGLPFAAGQDILYFMAWIKSARARWMAEGLAALALGMLFFGPWVRIAGLPVDGHELQERLGTAHRLFGWAASDSALTRDFFLSRFLVLIPMLCALTLASSIWELREERVGRQGKEGVFLRRSRNRLPVLTGAVAWAAVLYVGRAAAGGWAMDLGWAAWASLVPATGLMAAGARRILKDPARQPISCPGDR